jgi:hypothetical protein
MGDEPATKTAYSRAPKKPGQHAFRHGEYTVGIPARMACIMENMVPIILA